MRVMTWCPAGGERRKRRAERTRNRLEHHARQHATDTRAGQTANDSTLVVSQKRSFNHDVACQQSIQQVRQNRGALHVRGSMSGGAAAAARRSTEEVHG